MLVAKKDHALVNISEEDAEGFIAAGYELFREQLVPYNPQNDAPMEEPEIVDDEEARTIHFVAEMDIPEAHMLEG